MNTRKLLTYRRYAMAAGLAMALGPLTALSVASLNNDLDGDRVASSGKATPARLVEYDSTLAVATDYQGKQLADVAEGAGSLDIFSNILTAADLGELLRGQEQYTLFIPVNEAFVGFSGERFSALLDDKAQVHQLVSAHVVPGRVTTTALMAEPRLRTIGGHDITPEAGPALRVNGASIIGSEVAENGIVHYVDGLL